MPGSSSLLCALQTSQRLELFMIQLESTQNESKFSEKAKWILLIILDIQGVFSSSSHKKIEVSILSRPHTHHYIVCYYSNTTEHTIYINCAAGTSNSHLTFRNIFSIYSEKYCTLNWHSITVPLPRITIENNKGSINFSHFNSLQNETRLPPQ